MDALFIEPLNSTHDRASFSCGVPSLDRYIQQQAGQDTRRSLSVVYVLGAARSPSVLGYHTLSAYAILPAEVPSTYARALPHYDRFPAILLGRLAVDTAVAGQGFGKLLLIDALRRSLEQRSQIAAMAVVVHAIDAHARAFYEHFGFEALADHESHLFISMATIAAILAG